MSALTAESCCARVQPCAPHFAIQRFLKPIILRPKPTEAEASAAQAGEKRDADGGGGNADDALEARGKGKQESKRHKKHRGQNKHRPHQNFESKFCKYLLVGGTCTHGDACKSSHDIDAFMAQKPPDLVGVCPFIARGFQCPYDKSCRFYGTHKTTDAAGEPLLKVAQKDMGDEHGYLSAEAQQGLRKRTYAFPRSKAYFSKVRADEAKGVTIGGNTHGGNTQHKGGSHAAKPAGPNPFAYMQRAADAKASGAGATKAAAGAGAESKSPKGATTAAGGAAAKTAVAVAVTGGARSGPGSPPAAASEGGASEAAEAARPGPVAEAMAAGNTTPNTVAEAAAREKAADAEQRAARKRIDFRNKTLLAPLTTVGNLPFRRVCKNYGVDVTCGEMAMADKILQGNAAEWSLVRRHSSEDIYGVQIAGSNPEVLARCAEVLQREVNVDYIDLNCGCPIDLVFRSGAGSALMRGSGTRFERVVRALRGVTDCNLSIKLRTGIKEKKPTGLKIVNKLKVWDVDLITMHGRSKEARYTKLANWDYIAHCARVAAPIPFVGNGDVLGWEDREAHLDNTGISSVMVGRGALIKPWLFTEIKEKRYWDISANERFDMLKDYCKFGLEHWGSDTEGVEKTRRFLLEWCSFLCRYIPVGLLEVLPQKINERPPTFFGRNDLETLMASNQSSDWVKLSEMLLGPLPSKFDFVPKHRSNAYSNAQG